MPIELSPIQSFNPSTANEPFFQDWSAEPMPQPPFIFLQLDQVMIPHYPITIKIENVFQLFPQYSSYILQTSKTTTPNAPLVATDTDVFSFDLGNPKVLTPEFTQGTFNVYFPQVDGLLPGSYECVLHFRIFGRKLFSQDLLTEFSYPIKVNIINDKELWVSPSQMQFTHIQGSALPSMPFKVAGESWKIMIDSTYVVTTADTSVTFETVGNLTVVSGAGVVNFNVALSSYFNTPEAIATSVSESEILVQNIVFPNVLQFAQIPIVTELFLPNILSVSPTSLHFFGIKSIVEPVYLECTIISPEPISIAAAPWLEIYEVPDPAVVVTKFLTKPIPTANMAMGYYEDTLVVSSTIAGAVIQKSIAISYELQGFVASPYNSTDFFFTLENESVNFASAAENSHLTLDLTVKTFDYDTYQPTITVLPYKIPLFKNRGSLNIASIVGRLMDQIKTYTAVSAPQYKPAIVSYTTKEIAIDGSVLQELTVSDIKFVVGRKPTELVNNAGILEQNTTATRITSKGFAFINMLLPFGNYIVEILINNEVAQTYGFIVNTSNIYCRKLDFAPLNISPGAVVDFRVNTENPLSHGFSYITKRFLCFPDGLNSTFIAWQENNNLKNVLEFTGEFKAETDIENIFHNYRTNNTDILEKISSTKTGRFQIDTGWILKSEHVTIESLMLSKKAWIIINGEALAMVPLSKQLGSSDSTKGLISYVIEFQLNKSHDAQVYNF